MNDLPEISDDEFVPWSDADRAADFGDLLGQPKVTWDDVIKAMTDCFRHRGGCFHANVAYDPTKRLTADQARRAEEGFIWFNEPDNYIVIHGTRLPLTTEMVPCDEHRKLADQAE